MYAREEKVVNAILKYRNFIFLILVSVIALIMRLKLFSFQSYDFRIFLLPWYETIEKLGGIKALDTQVGNYGITYQTLIALFTYLPFKPIVMYKFLSVCFDYVLAVGSALLVQALYNSQSKSLFLLVYSVILFVPTVVMNSGLWGQCDSIYCSFIILSLLSLVKNKKLPSFIFLGVAFAFKFQTIFILPLYILLYLRNKSFSILYFGVSFISFYLCCLPGIIMGRNWLDPIRIYLGQIDETRINLLYPNLSGMMTQINNGNIYNYQIMKSFLIFLTLAILLIGSYYLFVKDKVWTKDQIVVYGLWIIWTCVMFLPSMHDRYGYLVDVLLVLLSFKYPILWINTTFSILESWLVYVSGLFGIDINIQLLSFTAVLNYTCFTMVVFFNKYDKLLMKSIS